MKPESGVKYLHINYRDRYGPHKYIVEHQIKGKHFVCWKGSDKDIGTKIAKKVKELVDVSNSTFLDWYDYDRQNFIQGVENGKIR